jgi:hypothetical protein
MKRAGEVCPAFFIRPDNQAARTVGTGRADIGLVIDPDHDLAVGHLAHKNALNGHTASNSNRAQHLPIPQSAQPFKV